MPSQGYVYVGEGLNLAFECFYTLNSRYSCLIYLVRMLCSVRGTSED